MTVQATTPTPNPPKSVSQISLEKPGKLPYMQNRELSWLAFNERVLELASDPSVPLLERLQFVSIFWSNLQEFFMVRVGSLTDLSLLKKEIIDTKSNMTPREQLDAIYARVAELYPKQHQIYLQVQEELKQAGVRRLTMDTLNEEQLEYVRRHLDQNVLPFLSPQIINARHPFPHLENGALYIIVRLTEEDTKKPKSKESKEAKKRAKELGAEGVMLGIIPLPKQANRVIKVPSETGFSFILLEDALEGAVRDVFSMYTVKHTNIICVTRNADLDATEGDDEREGDYREHMRKILKKRARLAPVRLESCKKLSSTVSKFLLEKLELSSEQVYTLGVPLDLSYAFALAGMVDSSVRKQLTSKPFSPVWPPSIEKNTSIIDQVCSRDMMLSYPYESMDPFVALLREAASDDRVVSIRITLYRLASQSHLAEALIAAAEAGKEVTALFELRARFDERNNIAWSQRFEEAGAKVIYGFHEYKVHSKICSMTLKTDEGLTYITQLGTGNYNEKTAKLYTDFSFITTNEGIGRDAVEFFRNMGLENASRNYKHLWVAPLQIKENILAGIDEQIARAQKGEPCGLFFKTNSITDKDVIVALSKASCAGVPVTLLVRGISCIVPGVPGYTENVRVVSIVGRLLEHSRIYGFGPMHDMRLYLSSADLMTRNMDKRVEIAWPIEAPEMRQMVENYIETCLRDTAKLRELKSDSHFSALRENLPKGEKPFDAQEYLIETISRKGGSLEVEEDDVHTHAIADVFKEALGHAVATPEELIADEQAAAARIKERALEKERALREEKARAEAAGEADVQVEAGAGAEAEAGAGAAGAARAEAAGAADVQVEAGAGAAGAEAEAAETAAGEATEAAGAEAAADEAAEVAEPKAHVAESPKVAEVVDQAESVAAGAAKAASVAVSAAEAAGAASAAQVAKNVEAAATKVSEVAQTVQAKTTDTAGEMAEKSSAESGEAAPKKRGFLWRLFHRS